MIRQISQSRRKYRTGNKRTLLRGITAGKSRAEYTGNGVKGDTNRPIVQRSTKEELHALFDQRASIYRAHATCAVPGGVSPEQMAQRIIQAVKEH